MRIHRLTATAFGPFPDEVSVDFDALTAAGLFLIHGPTGAGKTSLLDAICFALFADVPGLRDKRGMVSDHAAPTTRPSVELEFTSGTRRFRLHRSPAHERPKKRGTGTVEAPATVTLSEQRADGWAVLSTRNDEAAEVIHDVVGMGKEQFAKVAMLPQGEFAAFLTAKDEDRRGLLEKLFDISRFADVEDWLVDQRRASDAAVTALRSSLGTDLARLTDVVAASGLTDLTASRSRSSSAGSEGDDDAGAADAAAVPDTAPVPESPEAIRAHLELVGAALDAQLSEAMVSLDAAQAAEVAAARAAEGARTVAALRERARAARESLARLEAADGDITAVRLEHAAAGRAASVAGHLAAVARERAAAERSADVLTAARSRVRAALPDAGDPAQLLASLRQHDDDLRELVRLDGVRTTRARVLREQLAAVDAATAVLESADADRALAHERVADTEAALADALEAEAALDGVAQLAEVARDRRRLADEVVRDEVVVARLASSAADARTAAQDARDHEQDLVARRLAQMAAELAEGLVDGEACPVCGADEHPQPARDADRVRADELEEARERHARLARAAQEAADTSARAHAVLGEALRVLGVTSARELDLAALIAAADGAAQRLALVRARAARRPGLELALSSRRAEVVAVDTRVTAARSALAGATTVVEQARLAECADAAAGRAVLEAHSTCPCAGPTTGPTTGPDSVDASALQRAHQAVVAAVEDWAAAASAHDAATARLAAAMTAAETAASDVGFTTLAEVAAAARPAPVLDRLGDRLRDHDRARSAAVSVLDDEDVREAEAGPDPEVESLATAAQQARTVLLTAQAAQTEARRALTAFGAVRASLEAGLDAAGPALDRHHRIKDLADTFTGGGVNNGLRMRLTSYVLAARLEKVAQLANERLRIMGDGRYRLEHSDRLAARGARSGLALRVLDQWTGVSRETSTLSGGEAFMASLALALGLADAVREESGGFDLGTLFVDEGFGTLDDESLEQVISVLDSLREGGRAVGVVSHVAELRSRITSQLAVRKTASGSTVAVSTPGAESAA